MPKVRNSSTYVSKDESQPLSRLTMCDSTSQTLIEAFPEIAVIEADKGLQGRLYKLISSKSSSSFDSSPSRIVLVVGMEPAGELTEKEFHACYEEEHTPLFSKIPGWRRTRRAELVDGDFGTVPKFLAIHEWESEDSFKTEEYKHATSTGWRNHAVERVDQSKRECAVFVLEDSGNEYELWRDFKFVQ